MAKSLVFQTPPFHLYPLLCNFYTVSDNRVILARINVFFRYEGHIQDPVFDKTGSDFKDFRFDPISWGASDRQVAEDALHG